MDKLIGKKIADRYVIKELIGMGGMAAVYRAECEVLKRNVAVKVLLENLRGDTETVKNFKREAQAAASLTHNNIVSVYDVGEDDGINYMVMECVEGITLKEYIKQNGSFSWQEACNFVIQIASGLSEAHAHGVIHRDIKPQNVLVTKDKVLKVTDFGIAKAPGANTATMEDASAAGTVHYISPEQARGGYTDERSDLYSLGVVLYELLTGKVPYDGDAAVAIALMHIEKPIPDILNDNPSLPEQFRNVIQKAMAKEQYARYNTAEEFINDLRSVLAGQTIAVESEEDFGTTKINSFDDEDLERERRRNMAMERRANAGRTSGSTGRSNSARNKRKTIEEKKADRSATVLAILTVILVIVLGFGVWALVFSKPKTEEKSDEPIIVPQLLDMTEEEAAEILEDLDLKLVEEGLEFSDDYDEGRIMLQDPKAEEIVYPGDKISVILSMGPSGEDEDEEDKDKEREEEEEEKEDKEKEDKENVDKEKEEKAKEDKKQSEDEKKTPEPTKKATSEPTQTSTPTKAPTQAPTQTPTQAPTPTPTQAPTSAPTQAPTPTPTPTQAPAQQSPANNSEGEGTENQGEKKQLIG